MNTLICLTHFNRADYLRVFAPLYYDFCLKNKEKFQFLVAIDGKNAELIKICKLNSFPFIFSDFNEGVGITKNRVLASFDSFEYFYFIDDDVELRDSSIFEKGIEFAKKNNISHFSLGERFRFFGNVTKIEIDESEILFCDYGSGAFSFYSKEGIEKVGGFHSDFAQFKRYGHTEHSNRFVNNNLAPTAFVYPTELSNSFIWHNPKSIKPLISDNQNKISLVEQKIINKKLIYFPIETFSNYYVNKGGIPTWFPLDDKSPFKFLSKSDARRALARRNMVEARLSYINRSKIKFLVHIFLYVYYTLPKIVFKKIVLLSIVGVFYKNEVLIREFNKIRF